MTVAKLKRRFGVEVNLKPPRIPYRETITASTEAHGRHKKQTGGHGQFGDCKIRVEPLPRGSDFEFVDDIFGGSIPRQFVPAVEKGIQDARLRGFLAGYPMVDFRATVFDGSFHAVDSNELSFKMAASLAFKDAMTRARPTILEPIMNVEVYAPSDFAGDLMGDLNGRRGRIAGMDTRGTMTVIRAQVPMAEMLTYEQHLTSATGGRGSYHMEYSHYEEVPQHLQARSSPPRRPSAARRRWRKSDVNCSARVPNVEMRDRSSDCAQLQLIAIKAPAGSVPRPSRGCPWLAAWYRDCRYDPPAFARRALGFLRALRAFCALPPSPAPSSPLAAQPRIRAPRRRRSPTPFGFFGARLRRPSRLSAFGSYSLPTSSICATSAAVAAAEADAQDARVAARPLREARRDRVEQLADDVAVRDVARARAGARAASCRWRRRRRGRAWRS